MGRFLPDDKENPEHLRHDRPTKPPGYGPTDAPYRCYKINTDYVRFLVGMCDYFIHSDSFVGGAEEVALAAQWFCELQMLLMTGNIDCEEVDTMRLRQNPTNPCQLEQSFDNGASWSLAFDYSLCLSNVQVSSSAASLEATANAVATANALAEIYDETYQSVAPGMDYDLSDTDELRDMAYCFAVTLFLAQMGLILGEMDAQGWEGWDINEILARAVNTGIKLILGYVVVLGTSVHPLVLLTTVLCERLSDSVVDWITGNDEPPVIDDFLTPQQQEFLLCCAMDVIGGMTPSPVRFQQMFDGCANVDLTVSVQNLMDDLLGSERIYLAFLAVVQSAFEAIEAGQRYSCPCGQERIVFEFTTESGSDPDTIYGEGGWIERLDQEGCYNYIPEAGMFFGDEITGDSIQHRGIAMKRLGISGEIQRVEVYYNYARGIVELIQPAASIIYGGDYKQWGYDEITVGSDKMIFRAALRTLVNDELGIGLYTDVRYGSSPAFTGSCKISRIIIYGVGLSAS